MHKGTLVIELPFGRDWHAHNQWMIGQTGIVINTNGILIDVLWSDGTIGTKTYDYLLEVKNENR